MKNIFRNILIASVVLSLNCAPIVAYAMPEPVPAAQNDKAKAAAQKKKEAEKRKKAAEKAKAQREKQKAAEAKKREADRQSVIRQLLNARKPLKSVLKHKPRKRRSRRQKKKRLSATTRNTRSVWRTRVQR